MTKDLKKIVCITLFGLYIVTNLILLYFHEAWRDEAQVWLLKRKVGGKERNSFGLPVFCFADCVYFIGNGYCINYAILLVDEQQ